MGYEQWMLVEGPDDQHVLRSLLKHHGIPCTISEDDSFDENAIMIEAKGNIDKLLKALTVVLDDPDLKSLGIVVDADRSVGSRWDSLKNILTRFGGYDLPDTPDPQGTIVTLDQQLRTLSVGVWIMPDNQVPGILENFVSFLIPDAGAPLWRRAKDCVANIPANERLFSRVALPKAEIHTWLAWQRYPGKPLGTSITARYLDADADYALQLVNWVRRLFPLPDQA